MDKNKKNNLKRIWLFVIWLILLIVFLNVGTSLLTMSDTFANIGGVLLLLFVGSVSYVTKCFTNFSGNNEESND